MSVLTSISGRPLRVLYDSRIISNYDDDGDDDDGRVRRMRGDHDDDDDRSSRSTFLSTVFYFQAVN